MTRENRFQWLWPLIAVVAICFAFAALTIRKTHDLKIEAEKPKLLDRVHAMRLALLAASQSQDIALIAQDKAVVEQSLRHADEQVTQFEESIVHLQNEWLNDLDFQLLKTVEDRFSQFRQIYDQIDGMVSRGTNRQAYTLATGKGIQLLNELDEMLQSLTNHGEQPGGDHTTATLKPAFNIRLSLHKVQTLLIPHIFEPTDKIMDKLELQIDAEEASIQKNLKLLASLDTPADTLGMLTAKVDEFHKLRLQIVGLSRENSNVRSEALAARQRRDALLACESALVDLERNITALQAASMIPKGR